MDAPLKSNEIQNRYEIFSNSLNALDCDGVEIIPQTMAPFPWHFGGQRYQNLFVTAEEILEWCALLNLRVCFDISHSALHCKNSNLNFIEFSKKIAPITAHIHVGDAKGVNGEGLQIGEGLIDFDALSKVFSMMPESVSFIPEIWQGQRDDGLGFGML